jgi:protein-S-isoprenylcysteine O-methyltransferase Ste14
MKASTTPASSDSGRGEAWVVAQFALIAATVALGFVRVEWPESLDRPLDWVGAVFAILGANLVYLSARALGRSLTPFPKPKASGELVTHGPYRLARHPIYGGGILFFMGWALFASPAALVGVLALAVLWDRKARFEERLLAERYPGYDDYRRRTPRRLVPFVY